MAEEQVRRRGKGGHGKGKGEDRGKGEVRRVAPAGASTPIGQQASASWSFTRSQPSNPSKPQRSSQPPKSFGAYSRDEVKKSALPALSEKELARKVAETQAEDTALRADECRLRQELAQAEEACDAAKRREAQARDAAETARRRAGRTIEYLRNELAELMKKSLEHEQASKESDDNEKAWRGEMDRMVLSQADAMARRDRLTAEVAKLEAEARQTESNATKKEAECKRMEEKFRKERERLDVVRAQAEQLKCEAADELASKERIKDELVHRQEDGMLGLVIWRCIASSLGIAVVLAAIFRAI